MNAQTPAVTLAITLALAVACGKASRTGSLQGDVYLVMRNGDVKRAAGNEVRLVRYSDTLRTDMERVCATYGERLLAVMRLRRELPDSAAAVETQARSGLHAVMLGATVHAVPTGVNGHYRFAGVAPGAYALWAETEIGDTHYTWWAPIRVSPGDSLTKDLDNASEADARVYCGDDRVAAARVIAVEDSARRVAIERDTAARRRSWSRCFAKAATAELGHESDEVLVCYTLFLRTQADSYWADSAWLLRQQQ